ncbi:MAG TPA: hypothetical protein VLE97_06120 [Gaiellaceae bacterium]|nr:hypothetical protein [Gaiellaceae bacterium]
MTKHAYQGDLFSQAGGAAQGLLSSDDQLCEKAHYAAIVDAVKDVEIYHLGDVDCPSCLRRMADKHEAVAAVFRARLSDVMGGLRERCRAYDAACLNPSYCDSRGACCAGDPRCLATGPRALCHECAEMVDVVDGKLDPHHGTSGDGCPQNSAPALIYLHPKVAERIAELEAALVFSPGGGR